jgi:FkbM family methyltransferase
MYSQNNEEQIIIDWFAKAELEVTPRFFDIGAYHPTKFSNTRRLFELGWRGVLIEPDPVCMANLRKEYEGVDGITLLENAVITDAERSKGASTIKFYHAKGDAVSTTDIAHKQKWETAVSYEAEAIDVQTLTVKELMHSHGVPTFINLDVEAMNWHIFEDIASCMFALSSLKMVCVEHDGMDREMVNLAGMFRFQEIAFNPENLILARP